MSAHLDALVVGLVMFVVGMVALIGLDRAHQRQDRERRRAVRRLQVQYGRACQSIGELRRELRRSTDTSRHLERLAAAAQQTAAEAHALVARTLAGDVDTPIPYVPTAMPQAVDEQFDELMRQAFLEDQ